MKNKKQHKSQEGNIYHWSWGAFGFRWIWGLFFGVYWPLYYKIGYIILLMLILPLFVMDGNPSNGFFIVAGGFTIIDLGISIYLGIVGRRQAWWSNYKQWDSQRQFSKKEKIWQWAFFIALAILLISLIVIITQFMMSFVEGGSLPSDIRTLPVDSL